MELLFSECKGSQNGTKILPKRCQNVSNKDPYGVDGCQNASRGVQELQISKNLRFSYVFRRFTPPRKKPVLARNGKRAKIKHMCPASDQISPKPPAPNLEHLTSSAQPRHLQGSAQPLPRNWFPICGLRPRFARPRPRLTVM